MKELRIFSPKSLSQLVKVLNNIDEKSKILAGGTDLVIALNSGRVVPSSLVNIADMDELKVIEQRDDGVYIGAGAIFSEIAVHPLIEKNYTSLAQAAGNVGSAQIRNRGTIGGNLANSSPAGDMIPPLFSLGASVITVNRNNDIREIPVSELIVDVGKNILAYDEVIIFIKIPITTEKRMTRFVKLGNRQKVTIARISLAVNLTLDNRGEILDAFVALGAVGKTVFEAKMAEAILIGEKIAENTKNMFAEVLAKEVENSIPGRYSLPYKKQAIKGLAYDIFEVSSYE